MNSEYPKGYISYEGGPIVIADKTRIQKYRGIEDGGKDYEFVCDATLEHQISIIDPNLLSWDFGGAGTAIIQQKDDCILFVRFWIDDQNLDSLLNEIWNQISRFNEVGYILTESDYLVALWATEDGSTLRPITFDQGEPEGDFSMGGVAYAIRTNSVKFSVSYLDEDMNDYSYRALY